MSKKVTYKAIEQAIEKHIRLGGKIVNDSFGIYVDDDMVVRSYDGYVCAVGAYFLHEAGKMEAVPPFEIFVAAAKNLGWPFDKFEQFVGGFDGKYPYHRKYINAYREGRKLRRKYVK